MFLQPAGAVQQTDLEEVVINGLQRALPLISQLIQLVLWGHARSILQTLRWLF